MNKEQLEISFETNGRACRPLRSQQRRNRARWWFHQMRAVVDSAFDWSSAPPARPEQIYLTLARKN